MELEVVVEGDGTKKRFVGLRVCEGPAHLRLLLTRPFEAAGQIVSIPVEHAASVSEVESGPPREPVERVRELRMLPKLPRAEQAGPAGTGRRADKP